MGKRRRNIRVSEEVKGDKDVWAESSNIRNSNRVAKLEKRKMNNVHIHTNVQIYHTYTHTHIDSSPMLKTDNNNRTPGLHTFIQANHIHHMLHTHKPGYIHLYLRLYS